jgi:hypothetical protein
MKFNKIAILALFAGMAIPAFAAREEEPKSELVFPLVLTYWHTPNEEKAIKVASLNRKLNAAGLDGLPETIEIGKTPARYWNVIMKRIEKADEQKFFGLDVRGDVKEIQTVMRGGYLFEYPEICYRGKTADVPTIIKAMNDNFLHTDQGVLGFRYGSKKIVDDDRLASKEAQEEAWGEENEFERGEWNDYDTSSDTVLVLTDLGPQGDGLELYSTKIARCPEANNE